VPRRFAGVLSSRALLLLGGMVLAGLVVRVAIAFTTHGAGYDLESWRITARALRSAGSGVYDAIGGQTRWPYPGGFLPLLAACDWLSRHLGLDFDGVVRLPAILADLGIAYLVAVALRWKGRSERLALAGAALVALGPSFAIISGYAAQIDAVGALPALAGVLLWIRGGDRRGLYAGLLIGLGAAVKQPLAFAVLALLPSARSWRERALLVGATLAVPLLSVLPFLLKEPGAVVHAMGQNNGVPGFGGISAFVQPRLTQYWSLLPARRPPVSSATLALIDAQRWMVALGALGAMALAWRRRLAPLAAASLIWLAIFVVNPNFGYDYLIWGLPFFLAAGYVRLTAGFQAAILPASIWLYLRPGLQLDGWLYFAEIQVVWLAMLAALVIACRAALRGGGRPVS
jgi:hypothetical protein